MINDFIGQFDFLAERINSCYCNISDGRFDIAEEIINVIDSLVSKIKSNFKKSSENYRYLIDYKNYTDRIQNKKRNDIIIKNVNLSWSLIKSIENEIHTYSGNIEELKKKYYLEKGNTLYNERKIDEAFTIWGEVLKNDPTNKAIHSVLNMDPSLENTIKQKVVDLKERFKFKYIGCIDIENYLNGLTYFSFVSDEMFLYSRGPDLGNEDYKATISSINLNNPELTKEVIIDNIPIKISAPAIKYIKELNLLIYVYNSVKLTPVGFNCSTGEITNFELPVNINPINLSYILYDTVRKSIYILDTFAHNILMFTATGMFVKKYVFPINMQFPMSMVMSSQNTMIVGFYQEIPLVDRREFKKTFYPANKYFAILNLENGECKFIDTNQNNPTRLIISNKNEYFLYLNDNTIKKTDYEFNTIFSICTSTFFDDILYNKKYSNMQTNPSENKNLIYIADVKKHKKVFVFDV